MYNGIGQLIENKAENIAYFYNASGLVTEVQQNGAPMVKFFYNDRNHRVKKEDHSSGSVKTSYYVRDVAGQVMAIYHDHSGAMALAERPVYGSGRIGVAYGDGNDEADYVYELTDHLGNVRAVFKKNGGTAEGEGFTDYYPGGMVMPNRNMIDANNYRYGYQGQYAETDPETGKPAFELRLYDPRINRWLSPDPYGQHASPYLSMSNNWANNVDPDGGMDCPEPCDTAKAVLLDEVVVTAPRTPSWTTEVTERYGYGVTMQQWKNEFNLSALSDAQARKLYEDFARSNWQRQVAEWDRAEQNRETLEKLAFFAGGFGTIGQIISPGSLPTPRAFGFKGLVASGDDIALGLDENLFTFAKSNGFKTYRDFSVGLQVDKIKQAMHNPANRLHFNLDGFSRFRYGKFDPSAPVGLGNVTNWELHSILNSPGLLQRTTFYRFGSPTSAPRF